MTQFDPNAGLTPDQPPAPPPSGPPQPPVQPAGFGYQQPGYPAPGYYPYTAAPGTNGFAIASLICAFLCWPLGLIFGIIARHQIRTNHEGGDGLALAGIILSAVFLVLTVLYLVLFAAFLHGVVVNNNIPFNTVP